MKQKIINYIITNRTTINYHKLITQPHIRRNSNYDQRNQGKNKSHTLFSPSVITVTLAIPLTAYFIYQSNFNHPVFPESIHQLLRKALIAEHRSDLQKSQILFKQAYQNVKQILNNQQSNSEKTNLDPIKLSGIGIRWASLLEKISLIDQAILIYDLIFNDLIIHSNQYQSEIHSDLQTQIKVRSIEVAQKLASLFSAQIDSSKEMNKIQKNKIEIKIEKLLSFSVEEILKLKSIQKNNKSIKKDNQNDSIINRWFGSSKTSLIHLDLNQDHLDLPSWVGRLNQASCFESLGSFYAQRGKIEYALPLYLQTLDILIPIQHDPGSKTKMKREEPEDERSCQAATVMNNIASLLIQEYEKNNNNNNIKKDNNLNLLKNSCSWLNKSINLSKKILIKNKNNHSFNLSDCLNVQKIAKSNLINLNQKLVDFGELNVINQVNNMNQSTPVTTDS